MTSRAGLLVAAAIVVAVGVGWVSIRGLPWQRSEAAEAKDVLQPFVSALRAHDYDRACGYLASTSAPVRGDADACPARLRKANAGFDWSTELDRMDVTVKGHDGGKLYVEAFEPSGPFDTPPVYLFTLVHENGSLRIQRMPGFF